MSLYAAFSVFAVVYLVIKHENTMTTIQDRFL